MSLSFLFLFFFNHLLCLCLQGGEKLPHFLLHICWTLPPKQAEDLQAARQDATQVSAAAGRVFPSRSTVPPTSPWCVSCRYIDSQHCRVMQDIVSSKLYTEQFDAIQDCFRIIGFTEEVTRTSESACSVTDETFFVFFPLGSQLRLPNPVGYSEHRER